MTETPITFSTLLAHWSFAGGYALLAKDMRVPESRARQWLKREYLEPFYWHQLIKATKHRFKIDITVDDLVLATEARALARIEASRRSAQTRAQQRATGNSEAPSDQADAA